MLRVLVLTSLVLFLLFSIALPAQTAGEKAEKPLSNDDVVALVQAKLADSVIVAKIVQAREEKLDVSTDALLGLSKKGVSSTVIDAVMKRVAQRSKTPQTTTKPTQASNESPSLVGRLKAKLRRNDSVKDSASPAADATAVADVKLYLADPPKEPYTELGRVDAGKYNVVGISRSRDAVNAELRKKAAGLGADAVINITEDFASVSGVAVKLRPTR